MKLLLISSNPATSPYPVYPLGMAMVAAAVHRAGHEVQPFDFLQSGMSLEALAAKVKTWSPDVIGISIRNIDNVNLAHEQKYISVVRDIVAELRRHTAARIVLGGSAFSIMPEAILRETGADYGIIGEGERAMVEFLDNASRGIYPEARCLSAAARLDGHDIPSARYDSDLLRFYLGKGTVASVQSKRGCDAHCIYCTYPSLEGDRFRPRDPADVIADIRRLTDEHGAKYIFFTDSVFNDTDGHFLRLLDAMRTAGLNVPWTAFFKPGNLDTATVRLMKDTGLKAVELGTDATCDATLRALGKGFRFAEAENCSNLFVDHGIAVAHFVMFGGPDETRATVAEGLANLARLRNAVVFAFMGIRILPGTALMRRARQDGLLAPDAPLLDPVYYLSPDTDREWLEQTLKTEFARHRNWIFPPDALDDVLGFLHKMGFTGSLWDMLSKDKVRRRPRATSASSPPAM